MPLRDPLAIKRVEAGCYGAAIAVVLFGIMMIFISGFIWKMWRDETER